MTKEEYFKILENNLKIAAHYPTKDQIIIWIEEMSELTKELCKFKWVNWMLNAYMVLMLCTMITAFGESLEQTFGISKLYGVVLMDAVTMIILYFGAKGLVKLNVVVTPLIIAGIIFAFFVNNIKEVFSYINFLTSSVVYTSYNVISLPFVMLGMKKSFPDKKQILWRMEI